jgi:hydrogenase maturation protease
LSAALSTARPKCETCFVAADTLDGGTGGFHLLQYFHDYDRVVLFDATKNGRPAGSIDRLEPRYADGYPTTLTAHDIGLKDLLDAIYLLGGEPEVALFTVSVEDISRTSVDLSPDLQDVVPVVAQVVADYLKEVGAEP